MNSDLPPGHWLVDTALMSAVDFAIETGDEQRARELMSNPTVLLTAIEIPAGAKVWPRERAEASNRDVHERFGARFPRLVWEWRRRWSARQQFVASALLGSRRVGCWATGCAAGLGVGAVKLYPLAIGGGAMMSPLRKPAARAVLCNCDGLTLHVD